MFICGLAVLWVCVLCMCALCLFVGSLYGGTGRFARGKLVYWSLNRVNEDRESTRGQTGRHVREDDGWRTKEESDGGMKAPKLCKNNFCKTLFCFFLDQVLSIRKRTTAHLNCHSVCLPLSIWVPESLHQHVLTTCVCSLQLNLQRKRDTNPLWVPYFTYQKVWMRKQFWDVAQSTLVLRQLFVTPKQVSRLHHWRAKACRSSRKTWNWAVLLVTSNT